MHLQHREKLKISPLSDLMWQRGVLLLSQNQQTITMIKQVLKAHKDKVAKMNLPIVLGIYSNKKPKIVDLAKVGNILVGGATGQGKTNLLYAFA